MLTAMAVSLTGMLVWIFLLLFCINTGFRKWVIWGCRRATRTKANRKTLIGMGWRTEDITIGSYWAHWELPGAEGVVQRILCSIND